MPSSCLLLALVVPFTFPGQVTDLSDTEGAPSGPPVSPRSPLGGEPRGEPNPKVAMSRTSSAMTLPDLDTRNPPSALAPGPGLLRSAESFNSLENLDSLGSANKGGERIGRFEINDKNVSEGITPEQLRELGEGYPSEAEGRAGVPGSNVPGSTEGSATTSKDAGERGDGSTEEVLAHAGLHAGQGSRLHSGAACRAEGRQAGHTRGQQTQGLHSRI